MFGNLDFEGTPLPGFAFGMRMSDSCMPAQDYPFEIVERNDQLCLTVDVYTAFYLPADPDGFNVDLWEDLKQTYFAPATREGFYALSRTARTLLAGSTIRVQGGAVRCIAAAMSAADARRSRT